MRKMFKRMLLVLSVIGLVVMASVPVAMAAGGGPKAGCATIQDGTLVASNGDIISTGYDQYGYNYQAHIFNGSYADYDRVAGGPFSYVNLQMKWNDPWLSNMSCDGNNKLDRHYGSPSYIGSGAWLTNHDSGVSADGSTWTYFVKIVAVPADAVLVAGVWYAADGTEIGPEIWGEFAVIQQVVTGDVPADFAAYDFPFPGNYRSPSGAGLGNW